MVAVSTTATVHQFAAELLDTCEQILATTVGGPVAKAYLYPGLPALDTNCDQVCVYQTGIADEQTSPLAPIPATGHRRGWVYVNLVTLMVMVARCIRTGGTSGGAYRPPSAAQSTEDAEKVMEDGWALWCGISAAIRQEGLFGGVCQDIRLLGLTPLLPQGGLGGWTLPVQFEVGGIPDG